jgi:hypothetical protein
MEDGIHHFYQIGGASNLKWLIFSSSSKVWRERLCNKILDFFSAGFFEESRYLELQMMALVRIPFYLSTYATLYFTSQINYPVRDVSILDMQDFREKWERAAEDLQQEISQRIDDLDGTSPTRDSDEESHLSSPPATHRTNEDTDIQTTPESLKGELKKDDAIEDLSPILDENTKKTIEHATDNPFPSMEPPKTFCSLGDIDYL